MKVYMLLLCKTGFCRKVYQELMRIPIPAKDIYLLFGSMDILCRFEVNSIDEFKEKGFNQVRKIGGEKELIVQSMTFFVITSGGIMKEVPYAFIFLNTHPRNLEKVQKSILKIQQIMTADTLFGFYDIICSVIAKDRGEFEDVLDLIERNVSEIEGTVASIVVDTRLES